MPCSSSSVSFAREAREARANWGFGAAGGEGERLRVEESGG